MFALSLTCYVASIVGIWQRFFRNRPLNVFLGYFSGSSSREIKDKTGVSAKFVFCLSFSRFAQSNWITKRTLELSLVGKYKLENSGDTNLEWAPSKRIDSISQLHSISPCFHATERLVIRILHPHSAWTDSKYEMKSYFTSLLAIASMPTVGKRLGVWIIDVPILRARG